MWNLEPYNGRWEKTALLWNEVSHVSQEFPGGAKSEVILSEKSSIWEPPSENASKCNECLGLSMSFNMTMGHLSRRSIDRTYPNKEWEDLLSDGVTWWGKTLASHLQQLNDMCRTGPSGNWWWSVVQGGYTIPMQNDDDNDEDAEK